ncbi:DnaJ domain-containing protein [Halobellus sp. GM3]|uniref:DnaJ domain-containing protein n=1 Tax=Halobellus sp. GM3 TaxID=3458410 RepID=UPI00403D8124
MEDFYDLLAVSEDASTDEINRAWREKVRTYHPDVNDDARANAQFKTLKKAHEVLADERERAAYDRMGHATYVRRRLGGLPTMEPSQATADDAGGDGIGRSDAGRDDSDDAERAGERDDRRKTAAGANGTAGASSGDRHTGSGSAVRGRRRPLWYGWVGVLVAGAVYLAGLSAYLRANTAALSHLREAVATDPIPTLTATSELVSPGAYVVQTAAVDAPASLLFPVGAVVLALAFGGIIASFGRGTAYLYLAGGVAPLVSLGLGTVAAAPFGAVLALVVVLPLAATILFLVDVGRVLLRT